MIHLNLKHFVLFITIITFFSCKTESPTLVEIQGSLIPVNAEIVATDSIEDYIRPYRNRVNEVLDSTLAYAPFVISKTDGVYNSSEGNLLADILVQESAPIFKKRTGNTIDFGLLNYGGIRSVISKGNVTSRTAYEVMPFENMIVVAELNGTAIRELIDYLINSKRPQPISGIQIYLNSDGSLKSVTIQGKPFDENKTYFVATVDYLLQGGGSMDFLNDPLSVTELDYRYRNAMIDYFKKNDTIKASVDDRFMKLEPQ
jgi:2',3'-cyclic-nucleotide 2'-phosphodiesterase (5'-nucleotidase family)